MSNHEHNYRRLKPGDVVDVVDPREAAVSLGISKGARGVVEKIWKAKYPPVRVLFEDVGRWRFHPDDLHRVSGVELIAEVADEGEGDGDEQP